MSRPKQLTLRQWSLAGARFALTASEISGHAYIRSARSVRRDGRDGIVVQLTLSGGVRASGRSRDGQGGPGTIILGDLGAPSAHVSLPGDVLTLALERDLFRGTTAADIDLQNLVIPPERTAVLGALLLQAHARLRAGHSLNTEKFQGVIAHLVAHAATNLIQDSSCTEAMRRACEQTMRMLEEQVGVQPPSPSQIIEKLGVSRATAYRLFASQGGLFSFIMRQRLERVARMVLDDDQPLAAIAYDEHFHDQAHLNHAFFRAYGFPPGRLRFWKLA